MTSITGNNFQSSQNISNTNSTETLINNINSQLNEINNDIDQLSLLVAENETDINTLETAINTLETDVSNNTTQINQLNVDTTDITYNLATDTTTIANRLRIEAPNTVFGGVINHPPQLQITNSWTGTSSTLNELRLWVSGYFGQSYTAGNRIIQPGDAVISIYNPSVDSYTGSLCICPLTHGSMKSTVGRGVRFTFTDTGDTYFFGAKNIIYRTETAGAYVSFEPTLFSKDKVTGLTIDVGNRIGLNGRNIETNTTNIGALTTRVTNCENVNTTQTDDIATNTTDITNLTTRVTTAENVTSAFTRVSTTSSNLSLSSLVTTTTFTNSNIEMNLNNIINVGTLELIRPSTSGNFSCEVDTTSSILLTSNLYGDTVNGSKIKLKTIAGTGGGFKTMTIDNLNVDFDGRTISNCPSLGSLYDLNTAGCRFNNNSLNPKFVWYRHFAYLSGTSASQNIITISNGGVVLSKVGYYRFIYRFSNRTPSNGLDAGETTTYYTRIVRDNNPLLRYYIQKLEVGGASSAGGWNNLERPFLSYNDDDVGLNEWRTTHYTRAKNSTTLFVNNFYIELVYFNNTIDNNPIYFEMYGNRDFSTIGNYLTVEFVKGYS